MLRPHGRASPKLAIVSPSVAHTLSFLLAVFLVGRVLVAHHVYSLLEAVPLGPFGAPLVVDTRYPLLPDLLRTPLQLLRAAGGPQLEVGEWLQGVLGRPPVIPLP